MGPNPHPFAEAYLYYNDHNERNCKVMSFIESIENERSYNNIFITKIIDPYNHLAETANIKIDIKTFIAMLTKTPTNTDKIDFALTIVRKSFIEIWSFNDQSHNKTVAGVHFYRSNMDECNKCIGLGCSYCEMPCYGLYDYTGNQFSMVNTLKYFEYIKFDGVNVFGRVTKNILGFKVKKKGYILGKPFFSLINIFEYIFRMDKPNEQEVTHIIKNISTKNWINFNSQTFILVKKTELKIYLSKLINKGEFGFIEELIKKSIKSRKLLLY